MSTVPIHFRFTIRGIFSGTPETWTYGFHAKRNVTLGQDLDLGNVHEDQVTTAVDAFHGSTQFQSCVHVTDWRCYMIGTDNKMVGNGPLLHEYDTPIAGAGTAYKYPPQVANVVTLMAVNRGPAQHGRFYLPGPTTTLAADGRASTGEAIGQMAGVTTFLKAVSDAIDIPATPSSMSIVNVSDRPFGTGTLQEVDHIEMGRVLDTMRSRRAQLDEDRQVGGHIDW